MMFRDTVRALTPRERRIIALRHLNGKTQTQVAKEIGISQAQVSRPGKGRAQPYRSRSAIIDAPKPSPGKHIQNRQPFVRTVGLRLFHLDPAGSQCAGEGLRVLVQNAGDPQIVRSLGVGLVVVNKIDPS